MGYHGLDDGAGAEIGGNNRNFVSVDISWGACGASIRVNHWEKEGVGDGHGDPTRRRGVGGGGRAQGTCECALSTIFLCNCTLHVVHIHPQLCKPIRHRNFCARTECWSLGEQLPPGWRLGAPWKRD